MLLALLRFPERPGVGVGVDVAEEGVAAAALFRFFGTIPPLCCFESAALSPFEYEDALAVEGEVAVGCCRRDRILGGVVVAAAAATVVCHAPLPPSEELLFLLLLLLLLPLWETAVVMSLEMMCVRVWGVDIK